MIHTPTEIIDEEKGSFVCSLSVTTEVFGSCSQPARTQAKLSCVKWLSSEECRVFVHP